MRGAHAVSANREDTPPATVSNATSRWTLIETIPVKRGTRTVSPAESANGRRG
jgi:hypothetical protein